MATETETERAIRAALLAYGYRLERARAEGVSLPILALLYPTLPAAPR